MTSNWDERLYWLPLAQGVRRENGGEWVVVWNKVVGGVEACSLKNLREEIEVNHKLFPNYICIRREH